MNTCETCRHFEQQSRGGQCHRYPPPHPDVSRSSWCGEWRGQADTPEPEPVVANLISWAATSAVIEPGDKPEPHIAPVAVPKPGRAKTQRPYS